MQDSSETSQKKSIPRPKTTKINENFGKVKRMGRVPGSNGIGDRAYSHCKQQSNLAASGVAHIPSPTVSGHAAIGDTRRVFAHKIDRK